MKTGRAGPGPIKRPKEERGARYINILIFTMVMQAYCFTIVGCLYAPQLALYDCSRISSVELWSAACVHAKTELVRTVELLGLADTDFMLSKAVSCEVRLKLEQ